MSVSKAELLRVLKATRITADTRYGVTVEKLATATEGYASSYVVKQNGAQVGATINIPKDFLVKSASMQVCETEDTPLAGLEVGDPYLDFVINTVDSDATPQHIYINVADLVDVYTEGNGIDITNNEISVVIDSANANGLSVGANGLALAAATPAITSYVSASGTAESGVTYYTDATGTTPAEVSVGDDVSSLFVASVTPGSAGAMSAADKTKLNGIAAGANNYVHPVLAGGALTGAETADVTPGFGGTVSVSQVATDAQGHVQSLTTRTITIPNAVAVANVMSGDTITTAGSAGLMSAADKTKLDSLAASADETITDEEIAAIFVDE